MTFKRWIDLVDQHLVSRVGMVHDDITDQPWRVWFDRGIGAAGAADFAISRNAIGF